MKICILDCCRQTREVGFTTSMFQRLRTLGKILEDSGATAILREEEQSGCRAAFTADTLGDSHT